MNKEGLSQREIVVSAADALQKLDELKEGLSSQDMPGEKPQDPLKGAINNLQFIEERISPNVKEFFKTQNKTLVFGYNSLNLFGRAPIFYHATEQPNALSYAFDPGRKPAKLTEDILRRLWNANINRGAVKAFGNLSREEVIDRFETHILSSIN